MNEITHEVKSVKYDLANSIGHIHNHGLDYDSEIIYLMEDINKEEATTFIKNINTLQRKKNCDTILIQMMTNGGCWDSGMAIYSAIKACPSQVVILGCGYLYSMGSVILQAADKRALHREAKIMIHDGDFSFEGTTKQAETEFIELADSKKKMREIFLEKMKESEYFEKNKEATILKWLNDQMNKKEEVYLNAENSIKYGFIDCIFGDNDKYDWTKLREI